MANDDLEITDLTEKINKISVLKKEFHDLKKCSTFQYLKQNVSKTSYIYKDFNDVLIEDIKGFCSAGIFIINDGNFLAISENRNGKIAFNIIGGKRNDLNEDPKDTAFREFEEEVGININSCNILNYLWISESKYFLIHVNHDIDITNKRLERGILELKWIPIKDWKRYDFHPFSKSMISYFLENIKID